MSKSRAVEYAEHVLAVWAGDQDGREYGWPTTSSEARAMRMAQHRPPEGSITLRGKGLICCKETKPKRGAVIPNFSRAVLAARVDRLLRDMEGEGLEREANALRLCALHPRLSGSVLALELMIHPRAFSRAKAKGFRWFLAWLPSVQKRGIKEQDSDF